MIEGSNWLPAMTSFESSISIFNTIDENISFSFTIPSHWNSEDGRELINELNKFLKLRPENDIELHVNEVENVALG